MNEAKKRYHTNMDFEFYKLHTAGNDLILVNLLNHGEIAVESFPHIARVACKRHIGIGANGMVFLTPGEKAAIRMRFYDTRQKSTFCFDAITCTARYLFDSGMASQSTIAIETDAGKAIIGVIDSGNFRLKIGSPRNAITGDPILPTPETDLFSNVGIKGRSVPAAPIRLSRDMTVVITEERRHSIRLLAKELSSSQPNQNPVFVRTVTRDQCELFTWKSASMPDYAASAGGAAVAAIACGFCDTEITFYLRHYSFFAQWNIKENSVYVTSPAEYICTGSYYIDEDKTPGMSS